MHISGPFIRVFGQEVWLVEGRRPLVPDILGETDSVGTKIQISSRYSLIAPQ